MSREAQYPIGAAVTMAELEGDVHAVLHRLRSSEPVSWLPAVGLWMVSSRALCVEVMRDAKRYTVDHPGFSTGQVVGPSMLSLDGAEHLRHRGPFEKPFRKRAVEGRFRQSVADCIDGLIAGFEGSGSAELRRDFCGPVAVHTMIAALGMDETPVKKVLGWYDTIVEAVTRVSAGEAVSAEGREAFEMLRQNLLPSLKKQPESSLLAAASGMAHGLSDEQIISNAAVLLFGGIETTEGMIANALYHVLSTPNMREAIQSDYALMPKVVEESLRLEPAAAVVDRYTTEDVLLGSAEIPKGDLVQVSLAGANRDPNIFPDPDQFNPLRDNLQSHVTFAQGPHVCLGIHLARLEAQLAIEMLIKRLDGLRLKDAAISTPNGLIFRKPNALHCQWQTQ